MPSIILDVINVIDVETSEIKNNSYDSDLKSNSASQPKTVERSNFGFIVKECEKVSVLSYYFWNLAFIKFYHFTIHRFLMSEFLVGQCPDFRTWRGGQ